jgi:hypothetical protein
MRQTKRYLLCWSGVSLRFSTKVATARRIRSLSLMECFSQMSVISFLSASLIRRQVWYSYFIIGSYPYFWLDLRFISISGHHLFRCSVTLTCGAKHLLRHRWRGLPNLFLHQVKRGGIRVICGCLINLCRSWFWFQPPTMTNHSQRAPLVETHPNHHPS